MFRLSNDRKKVTKQTQVHGYRQYAPPANDQFFTYFVRYDQGIKSQVTISYKKRQPMVHINHNFPDGTSFQLQRVLLNKVVWSELKKYIDPVTAQKTLEG